MVDETLSSAEHAQEPWVRKIGISSVVAAGLATLILVVAARVLGADGYAHFLVVWGLFFALTGVLPGLQQEVVRSVATAGSGGPQGREPVVGTLIIGFAGLIVIGASAPLWAPRVLEDDATLVALVLAVGFLCYAWANHVNGTLAATRQWSWYARAVLLDGVLRFLFVGGALAAGAGGVGWAAALAAPTLTWGFLAMSPQVRRATRSRGDAATTRFVQRASHAMLSAGCSALVIAGFPVLLRIFGGPTGQGAAAGAILAVLMATRAPLLLFLNAYQGVAIANLVENEHPVRLMVEWLRIGLLVSGSLAGAGYFVGPRLLRLVFGSDYLVTGAAFVSLVLSAFVLAVVTLTGWTALSLGRHSLFVTGWLTAVISTSVLLTVPVPLTQKVSLSLIAGPLIGAVIHMFALRSGPLESPG